eukprot:3434964-Rhodomonas_salina.1
MSLCLAGVEAELTAEEEANKAEIRAEYERRFREVNAHPPFPFLALQSVPSSEPDLSACVAPGL